MFDREPALIARRLANRDAESDADLLNIYLDPMHDHQTGAAFQISASGVQRDTILFNDSWADSRPATAGSAVPPADTNRSVNLSVNIKPSPRLTISTGPQWNDQMFAAQYVKSVEDATAAETLGGRHVFANLAQKQLTTPTRVNVIVSPRVSVHGSGISDLRHDEATRVYDVDPDGGGAAPRFTFDHPDFNFKSLRVNAVFRWELKPGSTFYAVWTRQQQDFVQPGDFALGRDSSALFSAPGDDIFLAKMAYWIGR